MTGFVTATSMKRGTTAQVVLLPGGPVGRAVLDRAELWTKEGLLDPVFWVPAESVQEHHTMPARVTCIVMGRVPSGGIERRPVPLLATLGRESFEQLIVTSVRWLTDQDKDRQFVSDSARRLLRAIEAGTPLERPVGEKVVRGTGVRSLNVVFAATQVKSDELEMLISNDWQDNIVVSPEDRQRPRGIDRFTDAEDIDSWASFVTASVASLAGLWTGYVASLVPTYRGSATATTVPKVRVARTFARAVVSGGFSVDLARQVAEALADPQTPLQDSATAPQISGVCALDGEAAEATISAAVNYLLKVDSGALTYQGLEAVPQSMPVQVGFWAAIGEFARFSGDKLASIPTWVGGWFADRLGKKTAVNLFGEDSDFRVDARADFGISQLDPDLMDSARAIEQLQQVVLASVNQPPLPVARTAAPTLWGALRATVYTLVDGGSDSAEIKPVMLDDNVAVVPDVGMVIPAPWETWPLPPEAARHLSGGAVADTEVTWTELGAAKEMLAHLSERSADLEMRLQQLDRKYANSRAELILAERDYVEARELWEDSIDAFEELDEVLSLESGGREDHADA